LFELIDQVDQVEEASARTRADNACCQTNAEMGLAGAGSTDEDGVAPCVQDGAGGELTNFPLVDRSVGKDEAIGVLENWELGAMSNIDVEPKRPPLTHHIYQQPLGILRNCKKEVGSVLSIYGGSNGVLFYTPSRR
jgi:hypothetical protein